MPRYQTSLPEGRLPRTPDPNELDIGPAPRMRIRNGQFDYAQQIEDLVRSNQAQDAAEQARERNS